MLTIKSLKAKIAQKEILQGLDLNVAPGEVHAIMGPNGSGKSTLSKVIAGHPDYQVTQGTIDYQEKDLLSLSAHERAQQGIYLAFQYPVSIPGVSNIQFLKTAVNNIRKAQGLLPIDAIDFLTLVRKKMQQVDMDEALLYRSVNDGFSGGEKKRNEILQMLLLEPKLAILDETDSGLDIDALQVVAKGVNSLRAQDKSIVVVTHYQRLLDYIVPDYVHVLSGGKIIKSGTKELAKELELKGYGWLQQETTVAE